MTPVHEPARIRRSTSGATSSWTAPSRVVSCVVLVVFLTACSAAREAASPSTAEQLHDDVITVGSFDFGESVLLAEVYSQGLEAAGYDVRRAFQLGPREFVGPALAAGLIELVPEYAGTAAEFYSLGRADPRDDDAVTHAELVEAVGGRPVSVLAAAPGQDANTFVVTQATADRLGVRTLSDLRPLAGQLRFGGPPECPTRRLCLAGLDDTYGLKFATFVTLDAGGPLTHDALRAGLVDVALLLTTDPLITQDELVELADDRGLQPAESITPLVRTELIDRFGPGLVGTIDAISARLSTVAIRELNGAAGHAGSDVSTVVADWWSKVGSS